MLSYLLGTSLSNMQTMQITGESTRRIGRTPDFERNSKLVAFACQIDERRGYRVV
ncbi:hypothetical protein D3C72_2553760 [compost metagenome]